MGEGGFRPPEYTGEMPTDRVGEQAPRYESRPGREDRGSPELIVDINESDLQESQSIFAVGRGFESFDQMPPLVRAEYWTIESGVGDNYLRAEAAAKEAGLDRKQQLEYKVKALEARMNALARSSNKGHIEEFQTLDNIGEALRNELKDLK